MTIHRISSHTAPSAELHKKQFKLAGGRNPSPIWQGARRGRQQAEQEQDKNMPKCQKLGKVFPSDWKGRETCWHWTAPSIFLLKSKNTDIKTWPCCKCAFLNLIENCCWKCLKSHSFAHKVSLPSGKAPELEKSLQFLWSVNEIVSQSYLSNLQWQCPSVDNSTQGEAGGKTLLCFLTVSSHIRISQINYWPEKSPRQYFPTQTRLFF